MRIQLKTAHPSTKPKEYVNKNIEEHKIDLDGFTKKLKSLETEKTLEEILKKIDAESFVVDTQTSGHDLEKADYKITIYDYYIE